MGVRYSVKLIDGWRLDRDLTDEEWDLIDDVDYVTFDPMDVGLPFFVGNISGLEGETFIKDANDLLKREPVADPPFALDDWVRGHWIVGYWH